VVKVGDKLKVRVLEVDLARHRISLSARKDGAATRPQRDGREARPGRDTQQRPGESPKFSNNPFANRFRR
jgi:uncharacterized protein